MTNPKRKDLAETRETHRVYWEKLTSLHRETADLILSMGSENGETEKQGAVQVCEFFASHQVSRAIEQAKFLANYAGNESFFMRVCELLENYQDTLPEQESQAVAIVYNLCGSSQVETILTGVIPEICSKALIFLSGRRKGFILERMEAVLVTIAKAMESEGK